MQLYNKSKRSIDNHKPETLFEVEEEEGKKLLSLYGKHGEIIQPVAEKEVKPVKKTKQAK